MFDTPKGAWTILPSAFRLEGDRYVGELDRYSVECFLRRFQFDYRVMSHLRSVLSPTDPVGRLTDDEVIDIIAMRLASRDLVFREGNIRRTPGSTSRKSQEVEPEPAPAGAPLSPGPKAVEPDPNTFDGDHDGQAQAGGLQTGSALGLPVCAVCQKQAQGAA